MEDKNINQTNTQTPEENEGEKLFTQEQVNRIISDRLSREREKPRDAERENELNEKQKALEARENAITCREYISSLDIENEHKKVFLDNLDTGDSEKFKATVDGLVKGLGLSCRKCSGYAPPAGSPRRKEFLDARISEAFKPKI